MAKYFHTIIEVTEMAPEDTMLDVNAVCYWFIGADQSYVDSGFDPTIYDHVLFIDLYPYFVTGGTFICEHKRWPTYSGLLVNPVEFDLIDDNFDFQEKIDWIVLFD